jgi:hypothetical protein
MKSFKICTPHQILFRWSNRGTLDAWDMWTSKQLGWEGVKWIYLAQDGEKWHAFVNMVMNSDVP